MAKLAARLQDRDETSVELQSRHHLNKSTRRNGTPTVIVNQKRRKQHWFHKNPRNTTSNHLCHVDKYKTCMNPQYRFEQSTSRQCSAINNDTTDTLHNKDMKKEHNLLSTHRPQSVHKYPNETPWK
mmetsp:Transcript_8263/g.14984  ORF Transcript_8263/g.14984 Transcript_8263/m.14984 type:complete len:126 (+) Transcript_8263:392-769(+)